MKTYKTLEIKQNYDLSIESGIRVGGQAAFFYELTTESELPILTSFAKENNLTIVSIGDGSNSIYGAGKLNILAIKNKLTGIEVVSQTDDSVIIRAAAGETWDDLVNYTVDNGYCGIEALTAIPGTVGAAPVQNVGAYGQEVSNVITQVSTYDTGRSQSKNFSNDDCEFSYRNSFFKANPNRYIITHVTLNLKKETHPGIPDYKSAQEYFTDQGITNPSLAEIRDGITAIRWSKLPRPEVLPNCGSWFKNPILSKVKGEELKEKYPDITYWEVGDQVKLSAGWLVENTVGKNFDNDYFATYGKNALVLVNHSLTSSTAKFLKFEQTIIKAVEDKFGVTLEREPILVG